MKTLALLLAAGFLLAGCASESDDDGGGGGVEDDEATYPLPETVGGLEFVANPDAGGAAGIWVEDGYAYLSGGEGLRIVDVHEPASPVIVARDIEGTQGSRDVDLLHMDGRTYAVMAHGGSRVSLTDVTDPSAPVFVTDVTDIDAAHNIAVVPGTSLVYVSHSILVGLPAPGTSGKIDIIDFTDPTAPSVTPFAFPLVAQQAAGAPKVVTATTCHDISFEAQLARAYCAGVSETHIWDITDPLEPVIAQVVQWPGNQIHHGAWGVQNGSILIIGDEFAGALAGPMCSTAPNPYAALWFWDISSLATPVPLGYFQVQYDSAQEGNTALCTTHFGTPIEDKDLFVMGWYTAGTVIVDYSDPMFPTQVAHYRPDGPVNTWESRYWNGHVFTGDTARGIDILRVV